MENHTVRNVLFAALVVVLGVQTFRLDNRTAALAAASVQATRDHMRSSGWRDTVTVTRYVAGVAPDLAARAKDAEDAGAEVVAGTRVEGDATFNVPRDLVCPPDAPPGGTAAGAPGLQPGPPAVFAAAVDAQGTLARDPGGGWWYDAAVFVTLSSGGWSDRQRAVLRRADVRLSDDLADAWTFRDRGGYRNDLAVGLDTDARVVARYTRYVWRRVGVWGEYRHPLTPGDGAAGAGGVSFRF